MVYDIGIIALAVLTYLYVTNKLENRRLKKYIKEMYQAKKNDKPENLHYGTKEE